ncbi:hypothetical protein Tsubulata_012536 [Turnera subulata]|uniref:Uncharacterized protein n=1 Tax=Turnera subulata TaxID=218843 RepID=A0A9Q0F7W4_9ROSI|nr:hypothetical protein Tsubulata_012536 [Turnera subulata]
MAPSLRRRVTRAKSVTPSKPRRTQYKKKQLVKTKKAPPAVLEDLASSNSSVTTGSKSCSENDASLVDCGDVITTSDCSTPKAQRNRIPEIGTCPPAPKKQRVVSNCSLQRKPIAFFAPPDIELFFFFALSDIPV